MYISTAPCGDAAISSRYLKIHVVTNLWRNRWFHICTMVVAVSCGYDTCFAEKVCVGLCHLTKSMDRIETPYGFQSIVWPFVRHTVSMCLIFPALPEVAKVTWARLTNHRQCKSIVNPPDPTYGSTWVVLWLFVFRSAPSTFPNRQSTFRGPFPEVPSH